MSDPHELSWQVDSGWKISSGSGPTVLEFTGEHNGVPHNAMAVGDSGSTPSEQVFKFEFDSIGEGTVASVGVTNSYMFGAGFTIGGAFYGSNLHNGGALLVGQFGPKIGSGDVVTMKVKSKSFHESPDGNSSSSADRIQVFFSHNKDILGLAFEIPSEDLPFWSPAVSFNGPCRVRVSDITATEESSQLETRKVLLVGSSGRWILDSTPKDLDPTAKESIYLDLKDTNDPTTNLKATLHVINTVLISAKPQEGLLNRWIVSNGSGGFVSTMMAGPAYLMTAERLLMDAFSHSDAIISYDPDRAELSLYHGDVLHSKWVRGNDAAKPYVGNPFSMWQERNPQKFEAMREYAEGKEGRLDP